MEQAERLTEAFFVPSSGTKKLRNECVTFADLKFQVWRVTDKWGGIALLKGGRVTQDGTPIGVLRAWNEQWGERR